MYSFIIISNFNHFCQTIIQLYKTIKFKLTLINVKQKLIESNYKNLITNQIFAKLTI